MEDYKKIVEQLRNTKSESKRKLLDTAADLLEKMAEEIKGMDTDCSACRHNQDKPQCTETDVLCDDCPFDCSCATCRDNSNWEWRG